MIFRFGEGGTLVVWKITEAEIPREIGKLGPCQIGLLP